MYLMSLKANSKINFYKGLSNQIYIMSYIFNYNKGWLKVLINNVNKGRRWWLDGGEWKEGWENSLFQEMYFGFLEKSLYVSSCGLFAWHFYSGEQVWICALRALMWKFDLMLLVVKIMSCLRMRRLKVIDNQLFWSSTWYLRNLNGDI